MPDRIRRSRLTVVPPLQSGPSDPVCTNEARQKPRDHAKRVWSRGAQTGLQRVGLRARPWEDWYHHALTLSWPRFLSVAVLIYLAANLGFAFLYYIRPDSLANARPGMFRDAFFFSVETFATIGYGVLAPATDYANIIMTIEAVTGIMLVALTTGLMFARVSRPTARVMFSDVAVISDHDGMPTLMVRMGNRRLSQIVQAEVAISLVCNVRTREGVFMRRFHDLKPERDRTPVFAMSFLAMHRIDETSPLFGATRDSLEESEAEILITVTGLDETMGQSVHARMSYVPEEIRFGHRFADIFSRAPDGRRTVDYRHFHATHDTALLRDDM